MVDIKALIERCEEIIKNADELLRSETSKDGYMLKVSTSIENIYNLCYPNGIPTHLALVNFKTTLINQGFSPSNLSGKGFFQARLGTFYGFVEDLKKGLITSDLISMISIDVYNDLIQQAKDLRKFNTEPLNRASCVLARIVLEEGLKKICSKRGIDLKSNKANEANMEIIKKLIYSNPQFKLVETCLSIGNAAAHPDSPKLKFKSIAETQIDDMLKNIPEFLTEYL
jgi:hypothetical protein